MFIIHRFVFGRVHIDDRISLLWKHSEMMVRDYGLDTSLHVPP